MQRRFTRSHSRRWVDKTIKEYISVGLLALLSVIRKLQFTMKRLHFRHKRKENPIPTKSRQRKIHIFSLLLFICEMQFLRKLQVKDRQLRKVRYMRRVIIDFFSFSSTSSLHKMWRKKVQSENCLCVVDETRHSRVLFWRCRMQFHLLWLQLSKKSSGSAPSVNNERTIRCVQDDFEESVE